MLGIGEELITKSLTQSYVRSFEIHFNSTTCDWFARLLSCFIFSLSSNSFLSFSSFAFLRLSSLAFSSSSLFFFSFISLFSSFAFLRLSSLAFSSSSLFFFSFISLFSCSLLAQSFSSASFSLFFSNSRSF